MPQKRATPDERGESNADEPVDVVEGLPSTSAQAAKNKQLRKKSKMVEVGASTGNLLTPEDRTILSKYGPNVNTPWTVEAKALLLAIFHEDPHISNA
ncbi:hypothetical protein HK097_011192 [Rhizophlyctis rosea]|uniref:Uncharacterized protein n=1 Tax=Rhizophlyctis rosea TaxID=64517 RepID=A0AAD5SRQ6_9FUNG|nr:hypothetical protein HK097_011192 [Rhizophlyctis rosea]